FQAEDGIRDATVTGVQTCALPICDYDKAQASLSQARSLFVASGSPRASANVANDLADLQYAKGNNVAAHQAYEEAVHGFRATGEIGRASCGKECRPRRGEGHENNT